MKKQADSSGVSLAKKNALLALGDATYDVARAVRAYASENGNDALAGQVKFSRSQLVRGADKKVIDRAELIRDAAADTSDDLADYGVTQVKVTTLTKKIDAFRQAQPMPRQRTGKSSAATKELKKIFKGARELLYERVDGLTVQDKDSKPEFYNQYGSARSIVSPARRAKKSEEQAGGRRRIGFAAEGGLRSDRNAHLQRAGVPPLRDMGWSRFDPGSMSAGSFADGLACGQAGPLLFFPPVI